MFEELETVPIYEKLGYKDATSLNHKVKEDDKLFDVVYLVKQLS
jgi:hypothetical protein